MKNIAEIALRLRSVRHEAKTSESLWAWRRRAWRNASETCARTANYLTHFLLQEVHTVHKTETQLLLRIMTEQYAKELGIGTDYGYVYFPEVWDAMPF